MPEQVLLPVQIRKLPVGRAVTAALFACFIDSVLVADQRLPKSVSVYCKKNCSRYRQKTRSICNPAAECCISHTEQLPPQVHQAVQSENSPFGKRSVFRKNRRMQKSSGAFGVPPDHKGKAIVTAWSSVVSFCTPA